MATHYYISRVECDECIIKTAVTGEKCNMDEYMIDVHYAGNMSFV